MLQLMCSISNRNIFHVTGLLIVRGIHRLQVNSPHTGQWRGGLMFSLICAWTNGWANNRWFETPSRPLWRHSNAVMAWASYQIRKIAGCACAGNAGNIFPRRRFQRKPLVSDPGMHHGTCVTHVPWCMSGSLTCGDGENVPGIPGACAPAILRIWQEAHGHIHFEHCIEHYKWVTICSSRILLDCMYV